jgi:cardiolipin synthase
MWGSILEVLSRKAKEGVEVRVLYDGMNAFTNLPYNYPKQLESLGIRCKMFAPVRPFVSTHYNNRDHRKITVIDGHTAFTGGINLEDRYINIRSPYGHWKDTAVMVKGDAVQSFTMMFLQMWNYNERERIFTPYLALPEHPQKTEGYVIPYGDTPMDDENVGEMVYLDMLNRATDYAWIMTPYLIPDNELLTALQFAAKRGVDVRLILPGIPDKKTVYALSRSYYRQLLDAGVKIYEYSPGFIHSKTFVSDDETAVIGTANMDFRSLYLQFECGAWMYRTEAVNELRDDFLKTLDVCREITAADCRYNPFIRFFQEFCRLFAPLM